MYKGDGILKNSNIADVFRDRNMVVPLFLLKNYKKFNIEMKEFIFLMYLYNLGDKTVFNPNQFSKELNIDLSEIMNMIGILTDKALIRVEVLKNDKGLMEEVILLEDFFNKVTYITVDEFSKRNDNENSSIFSIIENEFARTLSSMEIEIIHAWLDHHFSEELIKEALKEAVFNGVSNLKYIDKILYEWEKNGVKTIQDVEERRKKFQKSKEKESDIDLEIVDWDWFEEDE